MRKLATIRTIDDIQPIDGADAIDVATIGGWNVVVKKGEHTIGEYVVFCEIDSWIPYSVAPFLCDADRPKEFEGVVGARLRTKKLRGIVSQGLILPTSILPDDLFCLVDDDVTEVLKITKYEKPLNAQLQGMARGNFPTFIPKTDQERIQNLKKDLQEWVERGLHFEVTEKLDGSSCTVYGVTEETEDGSLVYRISTCSRNLDLKETEGNTFWATARSSGAYTALDTQFNTNLAIQGEVIGNGIQKNQYKLLKQELYVFDMYDIYARRYLSSPERIEFCREHNLKSAPVVHECFDIAGHTVASLLEMADGKSMLNDSNREGLVFKCIEIPEISFKVISNKWLLKNEE